MPHAAIGGAVENRHHNVFNWAVFLLDFGRYQLPLPEGPANYLTDVNTGYKRAALEEVRHLWTDRYNEVTVNWELLRRGIRCGKPRASWSTRTAAPSTCRP